MANLLKSKFTGLLRGLLRRFEGDDKQQTASAATPSAPPAAAPAKSLNAKSVPPAKAANSQPGSNKSSKSSKSAPASASHSEPVSAASRSGGGPEIELPLAAVIAGLPTELRARVTSVPPSGQTIRLSAETVVSQLAFGSVKITFGELRQLAPGIFSNAGGEHDARPISLPLNELLKLVNPAMLARRTTQKVQVSEEIAGPFSERGRGFTFTTKPLKATEAQPVAPQPEPEPEPEPAKPIAFTPPPPPAPAPRQVAPPVVPRIEPPQAVAPPPAPAPAPVPVVPPPASVKSSLPPVVPRPTPPVSGSSKSGGPTLPPTVRLPGNSGGKSGKGNNGAHASQSPATPPVPPTPPPADAPPLTLKLAATPAPEPVAPAPSPEPAHPAQPTIFAKLADLMEKWPDNLQSEIQASTFSGAAVPLAGSIIEPGLKRGRVALTWKQIRLLVAPGSAASANDALELELPLKVVAPLFMSAQKHAAKNQTKTAVSASIPDLFFGFPQPSAPEVPVVPPPPPPIPLAMAKSEPVPPPPAAESAPAPVPNSLPPASSAAPAARPVETNFYSRNELGGASQTDTFRRPEVPSTDFTTRQTQPKEVVARAMALPGMAGVVLALPDGLRVASQVPPDMNADTLAGFLPQIFDRVNQSTRELRMGPLNNVNFTVGNVPWKIFRVNAIYFASFGRPGETLPSAQLAQLAADLDRKKS